MSLFKNWQTRRLVKENLFICNWFNKFNFFLLVVFFSNVYFGGATIVWRPNNCEGQNWLCITTGLDLQWLFTAKYYLWRWIWRRQVLWSNQGLCTAKGMAEIMCWALSKQVMHVYSFWLLSFASIIFGNMKSLYANALYRQTFSLTPYIIISKWMAKKTLLNH